MPSAAKNIIRALVITPGAPSPSKRAGSYASRPHVPQGLPLPARGNAAPARRPQPAASVARTRTPVGQPGRSRREVVNDVDHSIDGMDLGHSIEGVLDEEFDDFGCDLGTLLRLANGP